MNSNDRKKKNSDFELIKDGEFKTDWPMGYNLLLGYVNRDYPKKKVDVFLPRYKISYEH